MMLSIEQQSKLELLQKNIIKNSDNIYSCLRDYESKATVKDEIERSLSAIDGVNAEFADINDIRYELTLATFFPLNLPLYSLVLFAVIPSILCKRIYIRVPAQMRETISSLISVLSIETIYPSIHLLNVTRNVFNEIYVGQSDIVLFTGRYENAENIRNSCSESLFIYNGSGINPAVVFADADIDQAAQKIFEMRTFNSGQDCAGTDVIFVHTKVCDAFVERLSAYMKNAKVGEYADPSTDIGPILRVEYIRELEAYLKKVQEYVIVRGKIDYESNTVEPTVILRESQSYGDDFHEFFGPVFNVVSFRSEDDLLEHTHSRRFLEGSMYLSYFGACKDIAHISPNTINIHNEIINDVEQGNIAYGGYGCRANYVAFADKKAVRPILISREISSFFNKFRLDADR